MWQYEVRHMYSQNSLYHHGVLGMKWGVRRYQNPDGSYTSAGKQRRLENRGVKTVRGPNSKSSKPKNTKIQRLGERVVKRTYSLGARVNPREFKYRIKRAFNKVGEHDQFLTTTMLGKPGGHTILPTDKVTLNAIEKVGIEKHKNAKYNLNNSDITKLKDYTNSARYSRNVNSYLAIGEPPHYAKRAQELKNTLSKNTVSNTTVFRSCNLKFSFNGIAKKLETMSEDELAKNFDNFSKNYKGKTFKENRVFSTSTSPNFAIDTWRKVNPTASKTYNTYMILNTENCPGVLADGQTTTGQKLVSTRSNQEGILAPDRIRYDGLSFDTERNMFVISATAMGDERRA